MARHAEQIRRDVDATAGEYDKKLKQLRDALGKAELDRQRREADFQRELGNAAKKLRSQKAVSDQLQRTLQQERQQRAGANLSPMADAGAPAPSGGTAGLVVSAGRRPSAMQAPTFQSGASMFQRAQPFF
mmetsp:Transcript_50339/g.100243  ORF Transcript_50339/g.100243 Transcript_50339/m.100243 type:complete len:130 (-) Transcript_50339:115-504(-)